MIDMSTKQRIIIGFFNDGKSLRRLSEELKIHRDTVKKYVDEHERQLAQAADPEAMRQKGVVQPPRYNSSNRPKRALTEEVCRRIDALLRLNEEHRRAGRAKQQLKRTDILEVLQEEGFSIGYTTVCRYVNARLREGGEAFIRQAYTPGQSVEFDWAEVEVRLAGKIKRLMLAVFTSAYSNHRWAMLFYRQDMASFLQAHVSYFSHVGGVAGELVYDNMRVAVAKFTRRNADKEPTEDLLRLSTYYGFSYRFCNVRRANEKGHVERSVEYVRRKAFSRKIDFADLAAANAHLWEVLPKLNAKSVSGQKQSIQARFAEEQAIMKSVPAAVYDAAEVRLLRVDKWSCVRVDTNFYSVPDQQVDQWVEARIYALRIELYDRQKGRLLATHHRHHTTHQSYIVLDHFLASLRRKPGALLGSVAWQQADKALRQLYEQYFTDRPKVFIELLWWCGQQGFQLDQLRTTLARLLERRPHLPVDPDAVRIALRATRHCSSGAQKDDCSTSSASDGQLIRQHAHRQLQQVQQLFNS